MVPGIILLLLTKMTEAIGMADGIVLIQLGSICRDGQSLLIFCLSLIYIYLYSMILYMLRRDRKRRIPYHSFFIFGLFNHLDDIKPEKCNYEKRV